MYRSLFSLYLLLFSLCSFLGRCIFGPNCMCFPTEICVFSGGQDNNDSQLLTTKGKTSLQQEKGIVLALIALNARNPMIKCVRYKVTSLHIIFFLNESNMAANKYPLFQKNASNIDFSLRQIQEPYPTMNNNRRKKNSPMPLLPLMPKI